MKKNKEKPKRLIRVKCFPVLTFNHHTHVIEKNQVNTRSRKKKEEKLKQCNKISNAKEYKIISHCFARFLELVITLVDKLLFYSL